MVELIRGETVQARKHYRCFHCAGWIAPGQEHRANTLKSDYLYTLRTHFECDELWDAYSREADIQSIDIYDGIPPIREEWGESGEFQELCDAYRGRFPGPVTRIEFHEQIAEIQYQDRLTAARAGKETT